MRWSRFLSVLISSLIVFTACGAAFAADTNTQSRKSSGQPEETIEAKEVEGTVVGISNSFLSIEYGVSDKTGASVEMAFNLGDKYRIAHKKSLKEIKPGDKVKVSYEQVTRTDANNYKSSKKSVRLITWLRAAPKPKIEEERSVPPPASEEEPVSEEGALTLKGPKGE